MNVYQENVLGDTLKCVIWKTKEYNLDSSFIKRSSERHCVTDLF